MEIQVTGNGRNFNCLVVDDSEIAALLLVQLLEQIPELTIAGVCESAMEASVFLAHSKIDLLFLDIEMPGM